MSEATPAAPPAPPEPPKGLLEKLGAALPVGLTALATIFASMSNGALQEAMYWKSQAAQDQSRATNQWTLAGFKVDRSLVVQTAAAQLAALAGGARIEWPAEPGKPEEKRAAEWLGGKGPPGAYRRGADSKARDGRVGLPDVTSAPLNEMLDLIRKRAPEDEVLRKAARLPMADVSKAINDAETANERLTEEEWDPVVGAARKLVADARKAGGADATARTAAAQAALFEMEQRRYRSEATLNQEIGFLYEARVKVSSAESDKYRKKSDFLSAAMLVAQIGAVASSLALARKQKSALWLFAGVVGVIAIGVGGYAIVPVGLLF